VITIIKFTFFFLILFGMASCDNPSLSQPEKKLDKNIEKQAIEQDNSTLEELEQLQKPLLLQVSELEKSLAKSQSKRATLAIEIEEKLLDISKQKETIITLQADKKDLKSQLVESGTEIKTLEDALTTVEADCKAKE
jgi:chromosome segregation ATPase